MNDYNDSNRTTGNAGYTSSAGSSYSRNSDTSGNRTYAGSGYDSRNGAYSTGSGRYQEYRFTNNSIPTGPSKKKATPFWKKALTAVALGLIFGGFAGAGIYATQMLTGGNKIAKTESAAPVQQTAPAQQAAPTEQPAPSQTPATGNGNGTPAAPSEEFPGLATVSQEAPQNPPVSTTTASTGTGGAITGLDVSQVAENVMPAVVSITNDYTSTQSDIFGQRYQTRNEAAGSGFIVGQNAEELLIATNEHVVAGSDKLKVQFIDESTAEAYLKGEDVSADLAVISVPLSSLSADTRKAIRVATLGDSDNLKVGQTTIAIGNALGYGQSVTTGVISALNREVTLDNGTHKLIQTDAAINPGNSGGALLDINGNVIGINEAKLSSSYVEGMGYAIPVSIAKPIIDELMNQQTKTKVPDEERGYLGINGLDITQDVAEQYNMPQGVYVAKVGSGLAAEQAGLAKGDIITKFDGQSVQTMAQLQNLIQYYRKGQSVMVTYQQPNKESYGYTERTVSVTLGDLEGNTGSDSSNQSSGDAPAQLPGTDNNGQDSQNGQNGQNGQFYFGPGFNDIFGRDFFGW